MVGMRRHARPSCLAGAAALAKGPGRSRAAPAGSLRVGPGQPRPQVPIASHWPEAGAAVGRGASLLGGFGAARRWRSCCRGGGLGGSGGGAGLARLLGLLDSGPRQLQVRDVRQAGSSSAPASRVPGRSRSHCVGGERGLAARAGGASRERQEAAPRSGRTLGGPEALGLVYPERWRLAAAVGFLTMSSVISMSAPFFLGKIIDVIYTNPTVDYSDNLTRLCLGLSGVFLCGAANAIRLHLMQTSGHRVVNRRRTSLFSSILRQEVAFFVKTGTGELINRLSSDTALLRRSVTENLSDGLRAWAQASVGVSMMLFVSPNLATFVLSLVPPMSIIAVIYGRYLRKLTKVTQDSMAQATRLAEERIGNVRTVRAFGKEMTEIENYASKVDYVMQLARKEAFARAGFFGATGLSGNLIVLSVLYKGGLLMDSAHMTVGELSSFLMYAFWVGVSIGGSVTALVGPSGCGKSTVLSLLLRLYDPVSRTISLDGHDIHQLNPVWQRSKIGTASQEPILFSCSIAENIAYGADNPSSVTAEQVQRVAKVANAVAFIQNFPQGFNTVVGEKGILLSGGQKQRIAIARALFKNPKILLLDEAASALDAENEYLVREALDRLMDGRTV
ncbi:ATP-binding cassette sub- B member 10, mitochondrial [Saguinus oedipus]|uniref:ATP-binding cassette sub- B member 10, mitochondrial n=1 Tax=Saguinus oedipus TaxID=9490 RepID=A0ABQ9U6L4_SAGOE|nr:ATP-binding cassette sub- B member 10, mitochondrial [Saguinus oedipus]